MLMTIATLKGGYGEFCIKLPGGHSKENRDGWMLRYQAALSWIRLPSYNHDSLSGKQGVHVDARIFVFI